MKSIQNKQLIGIMCIFLFLLMGTIQIHGQSYNQSALMNKEWKYQTSGKSYYFIFLYTDKEEIAKLAVNNKKTGGEMKSSYYLSDVVVDKFQSELVGKNKSGKYIVTRRKGEALNGERLDVYEILELTDTTLKMKNLKYNNVSEFTAE